MSLLQRLISEYYRRPHQKPHGLAMNRALAALKPREREIIRLLLLGKRDIRYVAEVLGMEPHIVHDLFERALKEFKARFQREGENPEPSPDVDGRRSDQASIMRRALQKLRPDDRKLIQLMLIEGVDQWYVAKVLRVDPDHVPDLYRRALLKFLAAKKYFANKPESGDKREGDSAQN